MLLWTHVFVRDLRNKCVKITFDRPGEAKVFKYSWARYERSNTTPTTTAST